MCARKLFVILVTCKPTCVFTRTRNRMNVKLARWSFVNLVTLEGTCVLNISSFVVLKVHAYTSYIHRRYRTTNQTCLKIWPPKFSSFLKNARIFSLSDLKTTLLLRVASRANWIEEKMSSQMTGMKPAHEQSFDFDDYAYAQAPGSHGGGIDGENAFVPPRCVFSFLERGVKIRGLILVVLKMFRWWWRRWRRQKSNP